MKNKLTIHNTNDLFFASDYHLFHSNILKKDNRPFNDVNEMNKHLINNWNKKVPKNGIIFYLGDLSARVGKAKLKSIVDSLNGKIYFILGNHDDPKTIEQLNRFELIVDYLLLKVIDKDASSQEIVLSHYPILSWDKKHIGAWHLHGHSHQNIINTESGLLYYRQKVIDISVNGTKDYSPYSYKEIQDIMNKKQNYTTNSIEFL